MRIAYVLDRPEVSGGVKVVLQHASLLHRAGHDAVVVASGTRPTWHPFEARYVDASAGPPRLPTQDLVVGTFWSTVAVARALAAGPVAHFCQGYEGDLEHLADAVPAIEDVYRGRAPLLVVSEHLADLVRDRFGRASRVVPPPLDPAFAPGARTTPRARPRILVPGIFEAPVKGVRAALAAVRRLEASGLACEVTRVSMLPLSAEEAAVREPDRYLRGVTTATVAGVMREMDLLIAASGPAEGFGLPVLEALASGVPVVATDIPAMRAHDADAVTTVPPGDEAALADAARGLLLDPTLWRARRAAGLASADRFRPEAIVGALEQGLAWAAAKAGR